MIKSDVNKFVHFGGQILFVRSNARKGFRYRGTGLLRENLATAIEFIEENRFPVTRNALFNIKKIMEEMDEKYEDTDQLDETDADNLNYEMRILERVIFAEAKEMEAFFPSEKRYNVTMLFDDIAQIFGQGSFDLAPQNARLDFEEAGKCIVLDRGTAACYHLMRGTERTLKQLYYSVVKKVE